MAGSGGGMGGAQQGGQLGPMQGGPRPLGMQGGGLGMSGGPGAIEDPRVGIPGMIGPPVQQGGMGGFGPRPTGAEFMAQRQHGGPQVGQASAMGQSDPLRQQALGQAGGAPPFAPPGMGGQVGGKPAGMSPAADAEKQMMARAGMPEPKPAMPHAQLAQKPAPAPMPGAKPGAKPAPVSRVPPKPVA